MFNFKGSDCMELFNKREMAMAKELARELIIAQKQKSKENIIRSFNKIKRKWYSFIQRKS